MRDASYSYANHIRTFPRNAATDVLTNTETDRQTDRRTEHYHSEEKGAHSTRGGQKVICISPPQNARPFHSNKRQKKHLQKTHSFAFAFAFSFVFTFIHFIYESLGISDDNGAFGAGLGAAHSSKTATKSYQRRTKARPPTIHRQSTPLLILKELKIKS